MTRLHRKDLKHDEIREKMSEAVKSVSIHGRELFYVITIILAVGFIAFAWSYYEKKQQQESQNLLGIAMEKFNSEQEQQSSDPSQPKPAYEYKTATEKYTDALKDFEQIIKKYGNTPAADMARYQAGICAFYLNDLQKAEQYLKQSGSVSDKSVLFYQSRIALANLYNLTGKPLEAVQLLKAAAEKNKNFVPQDYLLIQTAASYEKAGKKKEATETYQKVLDQFKDSPISYQAQIRLTELKRN